MEKRTCLRQKCGVEFTPTRPKQKYCSTKCRTYAHRESLKDEEEKVEEPKQESPKVEQNDQPKPKYPIKEKRQEAPLSGYLAIRQQMKNGGK